MRQELPGAWVGGATGRRTPWQVPHCLLRRRSREWHSQGWRHWPVWKNAMRDRGPIRFADYDVLAKRESPSWNDVTRRVVDERIASLPSGVFFTEHESKLMELIAELLVPQPERSTDERIRIVPSLDRALAN